MIQKPRSFFSQACRAWPRGSLGGLAVAASVLLSDPAMADWRSDFATAIERLESGDSSRAATLLRRAIGERGTESSTTVDIEGEAIPYLPHYYLGVALDRGGDCRGALAAWRTSADQGQVRNHRSAYSQLQEGIARCTTASLGSSDDSGGESDPALRQARIEADRAVSDARDKLNRVTRRLATVESSRRSRALNRAAGDVEGIRERIERARLEQDNADRGRTDDRIGSYTRARRLASDAADELDLLSPEIDSQIARLPRPAAPTPTPTRIASDPDSSPRDGDETATSQAAGQTDTPADEYEASVPVELDLEAAASAFVGGDYEKAVELLADAQVGAVDATREFQAKVIRAAARFALWVKGAESDDPLNSAAAADVARCAELRPGFVFDERFFSPRFIRFYSENS